VRYRRDIRVSVTDPLGNATYVVVSGPGPAATVNGVSVPWSWKMVSPRVMRSAPEMAGKTGNYTNFLDDDGFRYCGISGTGTPVASASDCLTFGAPGDNWGFGYTSDPDANADKGFTNQGWVVGGVYKARRLQRRRLEDRQRPCQQDADRHLLRDAEDAAAHLRRNGRQPGRPPTTSRA
jgi:hypothetical protein